ncbi:arginine N-succinyltransferase (plasmid) [Pseudoalteromonas espejiana]
MPEICTLFLRENSRKGLTGRFLSRSRFLFMAQHSECFADTVIAEMRGVKRRRWSFTILAVVARALFSIEFPQADHLVGLGDKVFDSELMPKYPIYVNLLSKKPKQDSHVHDKTKPALKLLEKKVLSIEAT